MADKTQSAHALAVGTYRYGVDDFSEWVKKFEGAVGLAHGVEPGDKKDALCLKWLPLKLDETAVATYENCTKVTWAEIKPELAKLLIDPQEKYDIFAGRNPIKWDGKESFRQLATRIKRRINRHDLGRDPAREYFAAFRLALPQEYSRQIDVALGDEWNLEKAIELAGRIHLADRNAAATMDEGKTVSFKGASMNDDRIKSLELSVQGLEVKMGNMADSMETFIKENRRSKEESHSRNDSRPRDGQSRSRDRRDDNRGRRRDSGERDRRDDSRRSRDNRDRYRSYDDSPHQSRTRRDSYDRSRSRRDDSYDRRRSYDRSRDRYYDKSRERSYDRNRGRSYDRSRERSEDRGRDRNYDRSRDRSYDRSYNRGRERSRDNYDRERGRGQDRESGRGRRDSIETHQRNRERRDGDRYRSNQEQSVASRGTEGCDTTSLIAQLDYGALAEAMSRLNTGSGN